MRDLLKDFLLYSFFGLVENDYYNKEKVLEKSINRAYRDMCRTIRFNKGCNHDDWKAPIIEYIKKGVLSLSNGDTRNLDEYCDYINGMINESKNDKLDLDFSFGQAHKWFSMTLKYLIILDYFDNVEPIKENYYVPVDGYIITATKAIDDGTEYCNKYGLSVDNLDELPKNWSRWEESQFRTFFEEFNKGFKKYKDKNDCFFDVFVWESLAWLEQAKIESEKIIK